jgi:transposase-like protein
MIRSAAMAKVQNQSTKNDPVLVELPAACANEAAAVEFMEKQRWGDSPCCPLCGSVAVYQMRDSKTGERQANFRWRCRDCKQQYTVRKGTVFEDSRIEMRHWCFAFWRASTSKKGVAALEVHRQTGLSYKSCLFMLARIRFAMADSFTGPLSGEVEVDETYVGGKPRNKGHSKRGRGTKKQCVLAMVERGGNVKIQPVTNVTGKTLKGAILENIALSSTI